MKILVMIFSVIFFSISPVFCETGYLADYSFSGTSVGGTKLKGNLRVMLASEKKRLTGNMFYQEAGNPFPDLDEKDTIIDFSKGKKYIFTSESGDWISTSLEDEYSLISKKKINIKIVRKKSNIIVTINLELPETFGGKQQYKIEFYYSKEVLSSEDTQIKSFSKTSVIDFLSSFIDNEGIIKSLEEKMGQDKFHSPDKFSIVWTQGNKEQLNVKGSLIAKSIIPLSNDDFAK